MPGSTRARFASGAATAFASIAVAPSKVHAAQFEFKAGSSVPSEHPLNTRALQMWAAIEKESNGRIHTQLFPNSQLGGDAAMLTQLRVGALGFYTQNAGTFAALVPAADATNVGFAFKDEDEACRVADGPAGAYIRDEAAAKGLHFMRSAWNSGMNVIGSISRPIRNPDDLAGFKVRMPPSRVYVDLFKELGASPVAMTGGEVYAALQTHLVDGEAAGLFSIDSFRFYEVNKFLSLINFAWSGNWLVTSSDVWKTLPPDLQDIVERNNTKYAAIERADSIAKNVAMADKLERLGLTVVRQVDQSPFRDKLKTYYANWAKTFGSKLWGLLETSTGRKLA